MDQWLVLLILLDVILICIAGVILWRCVEALIKLNRGVTKFDKTESSIKYIVTMVDETRQIGLSTQALVDRNMSAQLLLTSSALDRVATLTNDPEDIRVAQRASQLYQEHVNRQEEKQVHISASVTQIEAEA